MFATFSTIAVSIFLEGFFFLLIGVIVSSLIEVYIPKEIIEKFIPKKKIPAIAVAAFLGLLFPICECGIVPVIHRLIKKDVPIGFCVTMLLSSPIVNIVVLMSTYFAFPSMPYIVLLRFTGGFIVSFITGMMVLTLFNKKNILKNISDDKISTCSCCGHDHHHINEETHSEVQSHNRNGIGKIEAVLNHSTEELFETGKYFILGILIAATIQSTVPRAELSSLGSHYPLSNIFMMTFSYIMSVCSNTDAFIARSFMQEFHISALLGFMVFGAMFDIKTTVMLKSIFTSSFIIKLIMLVFTLVFIFTSILYFTL